MSEYPNYTLEQLAQLILKLDMKEGVSPAGLGALQMFAKSALENASQQQRAADSLKAGEKSAVRRVRKSKVTHPAKSG